jgi:antitoxin (DNA-binding transcriptional repressor) of toxin-antitoxin stability system
LQQYVRDLRQDPIVLTEDDHPIAVLMPVSEDDLDSLTLGTNTKFLDLIESSLAGRQQKGDFGSADVRRELGLPQKS